MLTEYTTPGESIEIRDDQTIYSTYQSPCLHRRGHGNRRQENGPGRWQNVTTGEFHQRVV